MSQPVMTKKLKLNGSMMTYTPSITNLKKKKKAFFITEEWHAKVESQGIPELTGKFVIEIQNASGKKLTVLPREHTGCSKYPIPTI